MIKLVTPNESHKEKYIEMIREWQQIGGPYSPCIIEFDCGNPADELDYDALLNVIFEYGAGLQEDKEYFEKSDFYFIFDDEELVGASEVRTNLTELGKNTIGHIACGIRPSKRNNGYAYLATLEMFKNLKETGTSEVILCHYEENKISPKVIDKLGLSLINKTISKVSNKEILIYSKEI